MSLTVSADKPAHGPAGPLPSMLAVSESVVWPGCGIRKDLSILKWNSYFTSLREEENRVLHMDYES